MAWDNALITNSGLALIARAVGGETLAITTAGAGGGTVDEAALLVQTALSEPLSVPVMIASSKRTDIGINIRVQVRNTGLSDERRMKQVGLFAAVGEEEPTLFAIMQDKVGEAVPAEAEYPDFLIEFTAAVAVGNAAEITVKIDSSAVITQEGLDEQLKSFAKEDDFKALSESVSTLGESKADKSYVDAQLEGKVGKSEIPTSLPADGGNADTVNNLTVKTAVPENAKFTDTTYTGANGVSLSGTQFSNSGVRAVVTGTANGTISVNTNGTTANVAVKGLASAAYQAVQTAAATVGLHRISSGTAAATTTNCPAGCWYGKHD